MTAQQDGVIFPVAWGGRAAIGPSVDTLISQLDAEQRAHSATRTEIAVANIRRMDYRLAYINESRAYREQEVRLQWAMTLIGALFLLWVVTTIVAVLAVVVR